MEPKWTFSDHAAIFYEIKTEKLFKADLITINNYKRTNWVKFSNLIDKRMIELNTPIDRNLDANEIDQIAIEIENIFEHAMDNLIPKIKINKNQIELSNNSKVLIRKKKNSKSQASQKQ